MFDIDKLSIYFPVMKPGRMKVDQTDDYTKLLELEKEILLHPDNAHHLFMPVVDDIFAQDAYSEIYQQLEGSPMEEEKSIFSSLTPQTNVNKSIIFVKGKLGVGIVARDITGQAVGQADGLSINQNYITIEDGEKIKNPTMLFFEGQEDNYFLSNYTSSSNRIISEVLSQLMTTQVDNVKNPVGVKLGINMQTLSIVGYLTRRGIDPKLMIKFIKQPLILEYLKQQKLNESLINKNNGDELMKAQLIEQVLRSKGYREKVPYTVAALGNWRISNIELNRGLTERKFDQEQLRMFSYFLELVNQTRALSKWTNDQTADTTGLKDRSSVESMMQNREESRLNEFIDPILQTQISATGVISPFTKARDNYDSMWSEFYFTVNSLYKDRILAFKQQLTGLQKTKAKKEKALSTIDNDFILFFVHNFSLKNQSTFEQLTGKMEAPSLAQRIKDAKKIYPDNLVLKAFFPIVKSKLDETDNQYIDSLRLFERQLTTIDINDFVDSMRDIADVDLQLYKDLVTFVFYQSGLNNSPFNYSNIIPIANNKSNSPEYEKLFSTILQEAVRNAKQVVTNDAQADVIFNQFVNAFLHNNKQFLRSRSYSTYPYTLLNKFDKASKKSKLFDTVLGEFIPELGNTYMKRYNVGIYGSAYKPGTTDSNKQQEGVFDLMADMLLFATFRREDLKKESETFTPYEDVTDMQDINFQEEPTSGYRNRTIKNASADATIALAVDFNSAGERLTKSSVLNQGKKYISVDANSLNISEERVNNIVNALNKVNAKTLNIAGNGIYTMKGKYTQEQLDEFTFQLLSAVLNSPKLKNKIESIRSGGQTGFDEAGAKAGIRLGLPTTVLAPKGWLFRNSSGADIGNEQQFKERFGVTKESPKSSQLSLFDNVNEQEIAKNNPDVIDATLYQEALDNFLTYFPQYDYMNTEQQSEVAKLVANGTIQITCKFG